MNKRFYPAFLDIQGRRAVVIGGGAVAHRKAISLISAGADAAVISPELSPEMERLVEDGKVSHEKRVYAEGDLSGAYIAVAATDDQSVNEKICAEARAMGILINCVSPPEAGNFVVPASVTRGVLTVAVSTAGRDPALAKRVRVGLESFLDDLPADE